MEKYFTPRQANEALTLIRPIVEDILSKMAVAQKIHNEVKCEKSQMPLNESSLFTKLNHASRLLNEVEYHMQELNSIGVFLKDLKLGLVDFASVYQDRIVFLCWKLGEASVKAWHETKESFNNRKPIEEHFIKETVV